LLRPVMRLVNPRADVGLHREPGGGLAHDASKHVHADGKIRRRNDADAGVAGDAPALLFLRLPASRAENDVDLSRSEAFEIGHAASGDRKIDRAVSVLPVDRGAAGSAGHHAHDLAAVRRREPFDEAPHLSVTDEQDAHPGPDYAGTSAKNRSWIRRRASDR